MKLQATRVAQELKALRHDRNISQQELADIVGVTRATISNLERSQQSLSLDLFCRLAVGLNVDPSTLLEKILSTNLSMDLSSDVKDDNIRKIIENAIS